MAEVEMKIQYLEIVTPEMEAVCSAYEAACGVTFSAPDDALGGARTVSMPDGSWLGVRKPMRDDEQPVTRPYWLVDDIDNALNAAEAGGAVVAMPPTEIPDKGRFAIYFQGDIQHGLWEL